MHERERPEAQFSEGLFAVLVDERVSHVADNFQSGDERFEERRPFAHRRGPADLEQVIDLLDLGDDLADAYARSALGYGADSNRLFAKHRRGVEETSDTPLIEKRLDRK